ncbi:MAG TPA: response regulator [Bryobacteraceae bacterium]|jgi:CheY-like chemotaxis protein|nr:response regulator [Bryobacteraceae bacterium]
MPSRSSSASKTPASSARILLVDDNASGLSARQSVLEELGHRISTASSGAEAVELFARHKFDLVVTDFRMPKMDGLELIVRLRKQAPEIAIILLSGYVDALGLSETSTGADVVIQKSANEVGHLVRSVGRLLRRKKPVASEHSAARKKSAAKGN